MLLPILIALFFIFHNVVVDNLRMTCKILTPLPGADHGRTIKVAGLLGQRFLRKIQNMVDEDSHSTDLSVSGEEGYSTV